MALKAKSWMAAAVLLAAVAVPRAEARNYHCAGGIQYVSQGQQEFAKGNIEDAHRIYGKAVAQLTQCLTEDPKDIEAWDYLGVAYAELDSAEQSGRAFANGIAKATDAGDEKKKLLDRMKANQQHYWVGYFNAAIKKYQEAVQTAPPGKNPDKSAFVPAADAMKKAVAEDPSNAKGYCNLAAFQANAGQINDAVQTVEAGLRAVPGDSCLMQRKAQIGVSMGEQAAQTGDYAAAADPYEKQLAANPKDAAAALRLGQLYFDQGTKLTNVDKKADEGKAAFAKSASKFAIYHSLRPDDKDGLYNYTLASLQAGDANAAAKAAQEALSSSPDDSVAADYHNFLAQAYSALNVSSAAQAHKLVERSLKEGEKQADPAGYAQKEATTLGVTSMVAKKLKELGPPDEIRTLTMGNYPVEAWIWNTKKQAVLFSKGTQVTAADWNSVAVAQQQTAPASTTPKKKTTR
jgi:tetratricopeptide (TPR) repeat protein